jgi:uncharacterized protein (TIGR00369 family)
VNDAESTGLVALRRIRDGVEPQIPLGKLVGFRLTEAEPGRVAFELVAGRELLNSGGVLHGGVLSLVIDQAVGDAVRTLLPNGTPYMTTDLYVSYIRSPDVGATLRCTAEVAFLGGRTAKVSSRVSRGDEVLCECLSTLYVRRAAREPRR